MIRDGLLRDPERRRGGHRSSLTREQAIAIYQSTERLPVLIARYGVSRHVIVSIRGDRNYRQFTKYLKRGIRGCKHLSAKQIRLIRTMPGSNRTIRLALGIASSSVSRYRRPGSTRFPDQLLRRDPLRPRKRKRDREPSACPRPLCPGLYGRVGVVSLPASIWQSLLWPPHGLLTRLIPPAWRPVRGFPLVESPTFPRAIPITEPAHAEVERYRLTKCSRALSTIQFDESDVGPARARIDLTGER
jgi:hypothetical protein